METMKLIPGRLYRTNLVISGETKTNKTEGYTRTIRLGPMMPFVLIKYVVGPIVLNLKILYGQEIFWVSYNKNNFLKELEEITSLEML